MASEKLFLVVTFLTTQSSGRDNIYVNHFITIFKALSIIYYPSKKVSDFDNLIVQFFHFVEKEIDPESLSETPKVIQVHGSTVRTQSQVSCPLLPL